MPSLTSLAEEILANAKRLDEHLASQNQPSPSFDHNAFGNLSPQLAAARDALIDSTHTLKQLTQGPVGATVDILFNVRSRRLNARSICSVLMISSGPISSRFAPSTPTSSPTLCPSMAPRLTRRSPPRAASRNRWRADSCGMQWLITYSPNRLPTKSVTPRLRD